MYYTLRYNPRSKEERPIECKASECVCAIRDLFVAFEHRNREAEGEAGYCVESRNLQQVPSSITLHVYSMIVNSFAFDDQVVT